MSNHFEVQVEEWIGGGVGSPEVRETTAEIGIKVQAHCATELEDRRARTVRRNVRASAFLLASWFVSNWWRLRWEPYKGFAANADSVDWELSHSLAAAGGGYVWPPLTLASDGQHILCKCEGQEKSDDELSSPVRYLNSFNEVVEPASFESGVAAFVDSVLARLDASGIQKSHLHELWSEVITEQKDQDQASRRTLEALLGIDPDDNIDLITRLVVWRSRVGKCALEEIAAASKRQMVENVMNVVDSAGKSVHTYAEIAEFSNIRASFDLLESSVPWRQGKQAANVVRKAWGFGMGPIRTSELAERLQLSESKLHDVHQGIPFSVGIRDSKEEKLKLILRPVHEHSQRFDLARLVGDHIFIESGDAWKPATRSFTARQKFQRAFAAELLCPSDELIQRYKDPVDLDDLDEVTSQISKEFDVSQQVVLHHLSNRRRISRLPMGGGSFSDPFYSTPS